MKMKVVSIIKKFFSKGIFIILGSGVFIGILYLMAFVIGGEFAETIVKIIFSYVFPILFVINVLLCVLGTIYTYLIKDQGFRFKIK